MLRRLISVSTVCAVTAAFPYSAMSAEVQDKEDKYICDLTRSGDREMETYAKDICRAEYLRELPIWNLSNNGLEIFDEFSVGDQHVKVYRFDTPIAQHQSLFRFSLLDQRDGKEHGFISLTRYLYNSAALNSTSLYHLKKYSYDRREENVSVISYGIYKNIPKYQELKEIVFRIIQGKKEKILLYRRPGFSDLSAEQEEAFFEDAAQMSKRLESFRPGSLDISPENMRVLYDEHDRRLKFLTELGLFHLPEEMLLHSTLAESKIVSHEWKEAVSHLMFQLKYAEMMYGFESSRFRDAALELVKVYIEAGQYEKAETFLVFTLDRLLSDGQAGTVRTEAILQVYVELLEKAGRASAVPKMKAKYAPSKGQ